MLENSLFKQSVSVLLDYDVPPSAVRKLERFFRADDDWRTVESRLKAMNLGGLGLLPYELHKLERAIGIHRSTSSPPPR
jgi:hypothetical protein